MRPRLRTAATVVLASMVLLAAPAYAGSDIYSNIAPESQLPGGSLADDHPLWHYALDQHFDAVKASLTGGVDVSGLPALIAYFLAMVPWLITVFLASVLIDAFTFAFSLDLVTGSEATGGAGALEPVGRAIRTLYGQVFGHPWLVVAITLVGLWALWRGLVQRRYTQTAGSLAMSLTFLVVAMAFVTQPEHTIGQATRWTNQMSSAFLSLPAHLSSRRERHHESNEQEAKRAAADQLFSLLVFDPWVVLNFGGVEHCVRDGTGDRDSDPESVPVRPLSERSARDRSLRAQLRGGVQIQADSKTCINNRNKYGERFLRHSPGSDARDGEYAALNDGDAGKLSDAQRTRGYRLGVADKPATDAMEKGGQYQRLLMAIVVFFAALGPFVLLGALSVGVILVQVLLLLLLAFAPVALVIGVFPGRGHRFFQTWLTRLAGFLLRKAIYSLILAVLLAVCAAVGEATNDLGWLLSFGLQTGFFWAALLWRHQLTGQLLAATAGTASQGEERRALQTVYYARELLRCRRRRRRPDDDSPPDPERGPAPPAPRHGGGPRQHRSRSPRPSGGPRTSARAANAMQFGARGDNVMARDRASHDAHRYPDIPDDAHAQERRTPIARDPSARDHPAAGEAALDPGSRDQPSAPQHVTSQRGRDLVRDVPSEPPSRSREVVDARVSEAAHSSGARATSPTPPPHRRAMPGQPTHTGSPLEEELARDRERVAALPLRSAPAARETNP